MDPSPGNRPGTRYTPAAGRSTAAAGKCSPGSPAVRDKSWGERTQS